MDILVTGATGYIGSEIVKALQGSDHSVVGLARSPASAERLRQAGCRVVGGDMYTPLDWLPAAGAVDGIIHAAATFDDDMRAAEAAFLDGLLDWMDGHAQQAGRALPLVYTGGCWLYGPVGDRPAVEGSCFDPLPDFAYMVEHRSEIFEAPQADACVVHPAMVWDENGGTIGRFIEQARRGISPQIVGAAETRWPLVHRADVAQLYVRALERGKRGSDYHGVAESGVAVGSIARAIAARYGAPEPTVQSVGDAVRDLGSWAAGLALDQTMEARTTRTALGWDPVQPPILKVI